MLGLSESDQLRCGDLSSKKVQEEYNQVNFSFIEYINTLTRCTCLEMRGAGILVVLSLSVIIMTLGVNQALAQVDSSQIPPLSVKTDSPLYDQGDSVQFSGVIKTPDQNNLIDITVRVLGPLVNGTSTNIVQVKQITPNLDGSFDGSFIVSGPLWQKKGDYEILVNYGPQKASTTFLFNGGTGSNTVGNLPPPPQCGSDQQLVNGKCVPKTQPQQQKPNCGTGTVYDEATNTCIVATPPPPPPPPVECEPGYELVNGKCIQKEPPVQTPTCGPGTELKNNICVPVTPEKPKSGCLIATASFGSELAPQVQLLREVRDNVLYSTTSGTAFMSGFNDFYYSFSPTVADWERDSPAFKQVVRTAITPMLSTLSILNYVDIDSEQAMLGYGIGVILLNIGMYFVAPAIVIVKVRDILKRRHSL